MGNIPWLVIMECLVALIAIIYYIRKVMQWSHSEQKEAIFSPTSQVTFLTFILGFSILLIRLNVSPIGSGETTRWLVAIFTVITFVNAVSVWHYERKALGKKKR